MGNLISGRSWGGLGDGAAYLARSFVAALAGDATVSRSEMMVEEDHRIAVDGIGHKMDRWPKRVCCGANAVEGMQSLPGHEGVLPV